MLYLVLFVAREKMEKCCVGASRSVLVIHHPFFSPWWGYLSLLLLNSEKASGNNFILGLFTPYSPYSFPIVALI
jgi:hypothetical protein